MIATIIKTDNNIKVDFDPIKRHVKRLLNDDISPDYVFFSWNNTKRNILVLDSFVENIETSEDQYLIAKTAFFFLYTGRTINYSELQENSKIIAKDFLRSEGYPEAFIAEVLNCIDGYHFNQKWDNQATALVQDITHRYIGKKNFLPYLQDLWNEKNMLRNTKTSLKNFLENKYVEINQHEFQTEYAKNKYEDRKIKNVEKLQQEIQSVRKSNSLNRNKRAMTMFRTAMRNQIDLVNIADKKAGIMISINSVLLTLMIPILGSNALDVSKFIIPSIILIITCGVAVILATLATRPQLTWGNLNNDEISKGEKSLWYFGNFFRMDKEKYKEAIKEVIVKDITFENSVISDIYDVGHILGVKYMRLRWCYMAFAIGIGLTIISFGVSFAFL